jgi:hypothetical protein
MLRYHYNIIRDNLCNPWQKLFCRKADNFLHRLRYLRAKQSKFAD